MNTRVLLTFMQGGISSEFNECELDLKTRNRSSLCSRNPTEGFLVSLETDQAQIGSDRDPKNLEPEIDIFGLTDLKLAGPEIDWICSDFSEEKFQFF